MCRTEYKRALISDAWLDQISVDYFFSPMMYDRWRIVFLVRIELFFFYHSHVSHIGINDFICYIKKRKKIQILIITPILVYERSKHVKFFFF